MIQLCNSFSKYLLSDSYLQVTVLGSRDASLNNRENVMAIYLR